MSTINDTITTIATCGALIGSIWAVVVASRVHRIERDRDAVRDQDDAQRQASGISAWVGLSIRAQTKLKVVVISNQSPGPVFDVVANTLWWDPKLASYVDIDTSPVKVLPPGDFFFGQQSDFPEYKNPKPMAWTWLMDRLESVQPIRPYSAQGVCSVRHVDFTDGRGKRWRRETTGRLQMLALQT